MKIWKRLLAAVLCLLLLPMGALAEGGTRFSLSFSAAPAAGNDALRGLCDLLNLLTVEGTFAGIYTDNINYSGFDLHADVVLDGSERTRSDLFAYGYAGVMHIRSQHLLGNADVKLNMPALMEFGVKLNTHMGIPLHRLALLNPFTTINAFSNMEDLWDPVLYATKKTRTVSKSALLDLAQKLADSSYNDSRFFYWVTTLGEDTGMDEVILGLVDQLPAWVSEHVPKSGLKITVKKDTETWQLGKKTVVTAKPGQLDVDLPDLPNGIAVNVSWRLTDEGRTMSLYVDATQDGDCLLHLAASGANLPTTLPVSEPFNLSVVASGILLGSQEFNATVSGNGSGSGDILLRLTIAGLLDHLTVSGTLIPYTPDSLPTYDRAALEYEGTNVFSLNDVTLNEFVHEITGPLVRSILPIIAHLPASTCVAVMDVLEDTGMFNMLASGGFSLSEGGDDEDEFSGSDDEGGEPVDTSMYDDDDWDFDGVGASDPGEAEQQSAPDPDYEEDDWDF